MSKNYIALVFAFALAACATPPSQTASAQSSATPYKGSDPQEIADRVVEASKSTGKPLVLVGAGDIANCVTPRQAAHSEATGKIVNSLPEALVFTAGDNAYKLATADDFANCYHPRWGASRARTLPSPGNHDYGLGRDDASSYFDYFGDNAGPDRRGYYSVDFGTWHIVSLNSDIIARLDERETKSGEQTQDALASSVANQHQWLQDDLKAAGQRGVKCILAIWHHPRYNDNGRVHKSYASMTKTWNALMQVNADVVISGHEHRFDVYDPRDARGTASDAGMREFLVGNGGAGNEVKAQLGRDVEIDDHPAEAYGVLKMTLADAGYAWEFVPIAEHRQVLTRLPKTSGSGVCHSKGQARPG